MKTREKNTYTDRRTRYTRQTIKDSLLSLMQKKPFSKITVTEICRLSEINRGTFYLHYYDLDDVLDEILENAVQDTTHVFDHVLCPEKADVPIPSAKKSRKAGNCGSCSLTKQLPPGCWKSSVNCQKKISSQISCRTAFSPMSRQRRSFIFR